MATEAAPASKVVAVQKEKLVVDREKTCPFLLRLFTRDDGHHRIDDFKFDTQPFADELQIYTWRDATLKEICTLIKEVKPEAQNKDISFSFRLVFLSPRGLYEMRDMGEVVNVRKTEDDDKTLDDFRFTTGDYLDVAIFRAGRGGQRDFGGPRRDSFRGGDRFRGDRDRDLGRDRDRRPPR